MQCVALLVGPATTVPHTHGVEGVEVASVGRPAQISLLGCRLEACRQGKGLLSRISSSVPPH